MPAGSGDSQNESFIKLLYMDSYREMYEKNTYLEFM